MPSTSHLQTEPTQLLLVPFSYFLCLCCCLALEMLVQAQVHLMAGQPQGQQFHTTGSFLGTSKAGLYGPGPPTALGGGGGLAAVSTLSSLEPLWGRVGSWRIRGSSGCPLPSERCIAQPTLRSVLCLFEACRWGKGAVTKVASLLSSKNWSFTYLLVGCNEGAAIN